MGSRTVVLVIEKNVDGLRSIHTDLWTNEDLRWSQVGGHGRAQPPSSQQPAPASAHCGGFVQRPARLGCLSPSSQEEKRPASPSYGKEESNLGGRCFRFGSIIGLVRSYNHFQVRA